MSDGVLVTSCDGRFVYANPAAERILGLERGEVLDRTAADRRWVVVRPDGVPVPPAALPSARAWATGVTSERELVGVRRPDGVIRWLEVTTAVLPGAQGVLSTFVDTTERREEGLALRTAEERFRSTFDHGPIGKALVGMDGRWVRVNRKLCALLGYGEAELLARTFQDITHPDDLDADLQLLAELLSGAREGYEMEKRYIRRDGELVWALLSVAMVRDGHGEPMHFVSQIQDITQRKQVERELAHVADHDALTGLINRRRFATDLERELARIRRTGRTGSLVVLDLDRFKEINDSLGHRTGDQLLVHVAAILSERLRRTDVLARLGGDEFAIVLPETTPAAAESLVRELVDRIAARALRVGEGETVRVTASAGIAPLLLTATTATADDVMVAADLAMYDAKHGGRNTVHVRAPDDDREERERTNHAWSQRIREALDGDGFTLHYQPIATLETGLVESFEALLRITGRPGEPLVLPGGFLHVAERHGLLPAVDRWVAAHAIGALAAGELGDRSLSINVSGASLGDSRLGDVIEREVMRTGIDAARLQFEITETTAIASLEHAELFCRRIHGLGAAVALDDFGSGFASFLNLKRLPYDAIKVDGEFVRSAGDGPQERLLIEALLDVGRRLRKRTVAEFVEDQATHDLLRELGADAAQGYLIGRPAPSWEALENAAVYEQREARSRVPAVITGP